MASLNVSFHSLLGAPTTSRLQAVAPRRRLLLLQTATTTMSSDQKLRCALAFRLDPAKTVLLAKYDHAAQYESHGGTTSDLYGNRDKSYADAVATVIENDPPNGLAEAGSLGGFKVVQSDEHQVVYGADADKICR